MQKCDYCGNETNEAAAFCPDCGTPFPVESTAPSVPHALPPAGNGSREEAVLAAHLTNVAGMPERQLRIFEVVLLCVLAFGGSILVSVFYFLGAQAAGKGDAVLRWTNSLMHDSACLALLGYVLARRSKSFSNLGLTWKRKDLPWSVVLYVGGALAFKVLYAVLSGTGVTTLKIGPASVRVAQHLFGPGISLPAVLVQFLNPFFEEIIVRGYVMTEVREITGSATKAVLLSTLLQASYHLYQGGPVAFSQCGVFLVFSIFYAKTNRLTPVVFAHLYMDVGSTLWYMFKQAV